MNQMPIHPLEDFTRKTFGEGFAAVILRGLGVEDYREVGDFRLSCERVNEVGAVVQATFSVITPLSERAGEYHPLILAAILKLLLSRRELTCNLQFTFKEVLRELIWPDTDACRREIDDALEYHMACLYQRDDLCAKGENINSLHLISVYDRGKSSRPQSDRFTDDANCITFNKDFIEALREGEIKLADISFGRLAGGGDGQFSETPLEGTTTDQKQAGSKYVRGYNPFTSPFTHPETKPTVQIKTTPVSQRRTDHGPKILARPIGHTEVFINTGTIASTVLRALHLTAARHPLAHPQVSKSCEAIAENVYREVELGIRHAAYSMMKDVRRQVFENALRYSFGLMHTKPPTRLAGERGSQPLWRSPDQLISALWRAVEAIEFEGWKPGDRSVILNRRWNIKNVRTATIKFIVAYWLEIEGLEVGTVDSGRMRKWLNSLGLPCFSMLRSEIRQRITIRRLRQTLFKAYGGNLLAHMLVDRLNFPSD